MSDLNHVKGINARQIKLLQESGISTAEALAMSPGTVVADIDGLGDKTAKKLIWNARNALGMTEFVPAESIDENVEYITTGSAGLNKILGGGFQTGKLTEVYGPFKSGKTALAHTISVTCQLPTKNGGLDSSVAYIDTENTFSKEKVKRIAKRFGVSPKESLSRIYHARIYSSDHQAGVRLIIVDSLMALMRTEYVGIGKLAVRQGVLNSMIHGLSRIAETYNCAILLTNQVATKMMGMYSADDAIGGNIVAHGCHFRVMFKTKGFSANSSLKRRAVIVDAPDLPPDEAEFFITAAGIADTEKVELPDEKGLDFEVETLYEESEQSDVEDTSTIGLTNVKGIGKGTAENLETEGITTVEELLNADPEDISSKISGVSPKKISEWQNSAKALLKT
ncbi:MAG: DNA repair and recombination protein RadA [Promethearchaeota archaeon]